MIINKIRARNVLKYAELSIDLAERGLIAISGRNESGKSSIGETVCFALFGRTFSIPPDEIEKVVRWGENHCSVTLEFSVEDQRYELARFLDRDGMHSAKLALSGNIENPIARGVGAVADALFAILGFEYEEFVESFYLAQREITTPHPHSQAIKIMAGVAPLEQVAHSLQDEIAEREDLLGEIRAEWESVDQDVQALGIQDGRMPRLEDERHHTSVQIEQVNALVDEINVELDRYAANATQIERARSASGRVGFLRFLVLLLALASGGLWALLTYAGHLPQAELARELLARHVPQWNDQKVLWIGYLAAGLGVLFLLLWIRKAGIRRRIAELTAQGAQLAGVLAQARAIDIEDIPEEEGLATESDMDDETPGEHEDPSMHAPARPDDAEYQAVHGQLDGARSPVRVAQDYCEREAAWLTYVGDRLNAQIAELDIEIDDEESRLQEALNLSEVLNGLTDKREDIEERIACRQRGLELLHGAILHLSNTFNRDVKELVGRLLPLFTDGRYEHLQIDEGLNVRVFSSEKRDFMDLDEVSSGTQRQIMLALRLALSKKLLGRTVKGRQFAFLDEPFAFFDDERTRRALYALTDLGDDISQVWIVAQDFPQNCQVKFDTKIFCERGSNTLTVAG
ncbi:MAG: AAA family ATPase [Gammaproteobacteria bacterium]|nr:AAA family ATPase [Gammaproteobacteria bacterium]